MIDLEREICACNCVSVADLKELVETQGYTTLQELLQNDITPVGNKCELCLDEGYEHDGVNIAMIFSMIEKQQL